MRGTRAQVKGEFATALIPLTGALWHSVCDGVRKFAPVLMILNRTPL